jgi:hypothetical protein
MSIFEALTWSVTTADSRTSFRIVRACVAPHRGLQQKARDVWLNGNLLGTLAEAAITIDGAADQAARAPAAQRDLTFPTCTSSGSSDAPLRSNDGLAKTSRFQPWRRLRGQTRTWFRIPDLAVLVHQSNLAVLYQRSGHNWCCLRIILQRAQNVGEHLSFR